MKFFSWLVCGLIGVSLFARWTSALPADVVRQTKRATALVRTPFKYLGTAFCVHRDGYFVVPKECLARFDTTRGVQLVLNVGEADEATYNATVLQADDTQLCLLKIPEKNLPALEVAASEELVETAQLTAFGFACITPDVSNKGVAPAMTVVVTRVSALEKVKGDLRRIRIESSMIQGFEGAPLLNQDGKVVAIVAEVGRSEDKLQTAYARHELVSLMHVPQVSVFSPPIYADHPFDKVRAAIEITPRLPGARELRAELEVRADDGAARTVWVEHGQGNAWSAEFAPAEGDDAGRVEVRLSFQNGQVIGKMTDRAFDLRGRSVKLSDVDTVRIGAPTEVRFRDGQRILAPSGLTGEAEVDLGNSSAKVDLSKVVVLETARRNLRSVDYTLRVYEGKELLTQKSGEFPVTPPSPSGRGLALSPPFELPKFEGGKMVVSLGATVQDVAVGGSGRWFVLNMPQARKVAIFDLSAGKVTHEISVPNSERALIAAGLDKLVLAFTESGKVQRYDLESGKLEVEKENPTSGKITALCMGASSAGPLLVEWTGAEQSGRRGRFGFVDPATLELVEEAMFSGDGFPADSEIRASAGGDMFAVWNMVFAQGTWGTIVWQKPHCRARYWNMREPQPLVPAPDGFCLAASSKVVTEDLQPIMTLPFPTQVLPALESGFYFGVDPNNTRTRQESMLLGAHVRARGSGWVCVPPARADRATQYTELPEMPELALTAALPPVRPLRGVPAPARGGTPPLAVDKQYHLIPSARLFVGLSAEHDRLVVYRCTIPDLSKTLHLYFISAPRRAIQAGQRYVYQPVVRSSSRDVRFSLNSASSLSKDMKMLDGGRLEWTVPDVETKQEVVVSITAANSWGQVDQSFRIDVYPSNK